MNLLKRRWIRSSSAACETAGGSRSLRPRGARATGIGAQPAVVPVPLPRARWGLPRPPPPKKAPFSLPGALPSVPMPKPVCLKLGVIIPGYECGVGSQQRRVPCSGSLRGQAAAGKTGWSEISGSKPRGIALLLQGTAWRPFVVAPRRWDGTGQALAVSALAPGLLHEHVCLTRVAPLPASCILSPLNGFPAASTTG